MALNGLENNDLKLIIFGGKGGVGKTSCAIATALGLSENFKTLLISTDPAHSLSDCLEQNIGYKVVKVDGNANLSAIEVVAEEALSGFIKEHLTELKKIYEKIEDRFISCLPDVTAGAKSRDLAVKVLQNTYPYAATRISFNRFGNLEKGSRDIGKAFKALERAFFLQMILPVTASTLPMTPDTLKFPRLQLLDTGLVNYFSGIQKPLFQSHDMNAIFEGQIARQVVGQEILASGNTDDRDHSFKNELHGQQIDNAAE